MKKMFLFILSLVCILPLAGCGATASMEQKEYTVVYSFCGENEYFSISNGVVVLTENEESFYGGNLTPREDFSEIESCTMTFYIMDGEEKRVVLSNSIHDMTGGKVNIAGNLGTVSGETVIVGSKIETPQDLSNNLWFELSIIDLNGNENTYQTPLSLTEVFSTE